MSAKQMFEKLGYTYKENKTYIAYEINKEYCFIFYKLYQQIGVGVDNYQVTLDELKAINEQVKELGWLDE